MNNLGLRLASSNASRSQCIASRITVSRWSVRALHTPRALVYPIEEGLGDFLPPAALKTVAVDYQQGLLERLNEEVRGTEEENKSVTQTVINTAPHREKALAFNYASLALNNSFFLDHLKPPTPSAPNHQAEISPRLGDTIRMQHGSLAQLKSAFSAAALGMFTNGWVWFVTDRNGNTGVLPTFGPGTLLIRSRSYMASSKGLILGEGLGQFMRGDPLTPQERALSNDAPESSTDGLSAPRNSVTSQSPPSPSSPTSGISGANPATGNPGSRSFHSGVRSPYQIEMDRLPSSVWGEEDPSAISRSVPRSKVDMLNVGEVLHPLFCVSVNEHAWMSAGYGVWGKEEWLKKFWSVVDWGKVSLAYEKAYQDKSAF
ncbi:Manganese/iron superoxide dismutase [Infundibulicybe gibba]|nr:Manganese/iron superoxide dismutase [Infundibulicybe gibba]